MTMLVIVGSALVGLHLTPTPLRVRGVTGQRTTCVQCGWGPEPVWSSLSVASIADASSGLKAITIEPPEETSDGFAVGGQYVQIREPGAEKAGFFAIASAPGVKPFEFLIKEQPASDWSPGTGWLTGASAGASLEMSQAMGGGFKVADKLDGVSKVLLFAAGSGISPLRSTIESGVLKEKEVMLFYGAQTPEQMAYMDKFEEWEALGVKVTPVISKPEGKSWTGATGYVQDVAKEAGAITDADSTVALLCGMKGMAEGVKEMCVSAGMDEAMVITNF